MSTRLNWRQAGCIYLWRYHENTKNFPGWHMTANATGCEALLSLIDQMENAQWSCEQSIHTLEPTASVLAVPSNHGNRWSAATTLHLKVRKLPNAEQEWKLSCQEGVVTLIIGTTRLTELKKGVLDISQGLGDYCIPSDAPEEQLLWFWWHLK